MNRKIMKCPHCQKELPENYGAGWCPFCGCDLAASETGLTVRPATYKINWLLFWIVLLAPAAVAFLASLANFEGIAVFSPIFGGLIAGNVCATVLARRMGRTRGSKILLGMLFSVLLSALSFGLGFAGCSLGGFQMNFH